MANPVTYPTGSTVSYGVYSYTGYIVQTYDIVKKNNVVAEIFDENGVRSHVRYDDLTKELSLEMYVNGGAEPIPGEVLTYHSVKYEILEVTVKGSQKDFVRVAVKAKNSEDVALP